MHEATAKLSRIGQDAAAVALRFQLTSRRSASTTHETCSASFRPSQQRCRTLHNWSGQRTTAIGQRNHDRDRYPTRSGIAWLQAWSVRQQIRSISDTSKPSTPPQPTVPRPMRPAPIRRAAPIKQPTDSNRRAPPSIPASAVRIPEPDAVVDTPIITLANSPYRLPGPLYPEIPSSPEQTYREAWYRFSSDTSWYGETTRYLQRVASEVQEAKKNELNLMALGSHDGNRNKSTVPSAAFYMRLYLVVGMWVKFIGLWFGQFFGGTKYPRVWGYLFILSITMGTIEAWKTMTGRIRKRGALSEHSVDAPVGEIGGESEDSETQDAVQASGRSVAISSTAHDAEDNQDILDVIARNVVSATEVVRAAPVEGLADVLAVSPDTADAQLLTTNEENESGIDRDQTSSTQIQLNGRLGIDLQPQSRSWWNFWS